MTDSLTQSRAIFRLHGRAPVPAEGGVPAGVPVRAIGEPKKRTDPNLILRAAYCDNRNIAIAVIAEKLGITDLGVCMANLSDADRWRKLPVFARLDEIGHWLRAECFAAMDIVDAPHVDTIGD